MPPHMGCGANKIKNEGFMTTNVIGGSAGWGAICRNVATLAIGAGLMSGPGLAQAECHIAASTVIMCMGPNGASNSAMAYRAYGMNTKKINTSYTRELLHQYNCATVTDPKRTLSFGRLQSGRVATQDGWVDVEFVGWVHDGLDDTRYVAKPYLKGECKKIGIDDLRVDPAARNDNPNMPTVVHYDTNGLAN
ncbi:hypothetical protein ACN262_08380 [Burkholderia gladioli]|uniref:hypothetical protein n=1 Tax=Burkholderia gladioli TaxID=28095 RepID=UPI003AFB054F